MNTLGLIIGLMALGLLLTIILSAEHIRNRAWRRCLWCWHYFDDQGNRTIEKPFGFLSIPNGVCPDCGKKARYR